MKAKTILTAVFLMSTNVAFASGGLSIDNVKETNFVSENNSKQVIIVQGPLDKFNSQVSNSPVNTVDTEKLRKDYDGQS